MTGPATGAGVYSTDCPIGQYRDANGYCRDIPDEDDPGDAEEGICDLVSSSVSFFGWEVPPKGPNIWTHWTKRCTKKDSCWVLGLKIFLWQIHINHRIEEAIQDPKKQVLFDPVGRNEHIDKIEIALAKYSECVSLFMTHVPPCCGDRLHFKRYFRVDYPARVHIQSQLATALVVIIIVVAGGLIVVEIGHASAGAATLIRFVPA